MEGDLINYCGLNMKKARENPRFLAHGVTLFVTFCFSSSLEE